MGRGTSEGDPWHLSHSGNEYLVVSTEVCTQSRGPARTRPKTRLGIFDGAFLSNRVDPSTLK